jgi:polysaccharide biosynthesis/export protein
VTALASCARLSRAAAETGIAYPGKIGIRAMMKRTAFFFLVVVGVSLVPSHALAQGAPKAGTQPKPAPAQPAPPPPPGYVIGPEDVLQVSYWRDTSVSAEVTVRPDGMISLPLLNDVPAEGLTPEQLREKLTQLAKTKYFEGDPNITITVRTINSRKAYITGQVARPGPYQLTAPTTVLQLIATAGGLTEFAKQKEISVMRAENGKQLRFSFNYKDVSKGKNLTQNIELKPGDTVIVP